MNTATQNPTSVAFRQTWPCPVEVLVVHTQLDFNYHESDCN